MPSVRQILLETRKNLLEHKRKRIQQENVKRLRRLKSSVDNHRRLDILQNPEEYYKVNLERERHSRKFKVKQNVYKVNVKTLPFRDNSKGVRQLLKHILQDVKERMKCRPDDYLRLNLHHPSLQSDIWFEFTQSKNLNEDLVMNKIEAVQQSKKDLTLTDGAAEMELFHVHYSQGAGGNQMKHLQGNRETFKNEKRSIVRIWNEDTICLARAIVVARCHAQKPADKDSPEYAVWKQKWERIRRSDVLSKKQKNEALELMKSADCSPHTTFGAGPGEWVKMQKILEPQYRLKVYEFKRGAPRLELIPIYKGTGNGTCLNILLDAGHYETILSMPGILGHSYYCDYCDVGYSHIEEHRTACPHRCSFCLANTPCAPDGTCVQCSICKGFFKSMDCYQRHLRPYSERSRVTVCDLMARCDRCNEWMSKKLLSKHKCGGQKHCRICKRVVNEDHKCYVQVIPKHGDDIKDRKRPLQMYIYFDFECTQENSIHVPNLCVAHRVCHCCHHLPVDQPCKRCESFGPRRHIFRGPTTLKDFMDWLLATTPHAQGYASAMVNKDAIVIAHNFKGYDGQFILNYLVHTACITPTVIMNGTKILSMQALDLKFIDSFNYLPFALAKMPSAFGLKELKKGYFPHFFNTEANQNYVGPYPAASFYGPDDMTSSARAAFYVWYEEQQGKTFDFQKEFLAYCISDVDILQRCCAQFAQTIHALVKVYPFREAITFASTANLAYRRRFMPPDSIAIIPNLGYHPARQFSLKASRWLSWLGRDLSIQHAWNGGEVKFGNFTVDGYDESTRTVYEFYGCYWHGCPICFPDLATETHPHRTQFTYNSLYELTLTRELALKEQGFNLVTLWEHEFDKQFQKSEPFQDFVRELEFQPPLNPREALYGGRTNATRLYCVEGDMRYVDVCSLYPYVLKHRPFPLGHPEIITEDFQDVRSYFGIILCRVLPPRGLYHPVLPYRTGGKLLFPLCRTCAEERPTDPHYRCNHTNAQRRFTGTWITCELIKALDCGYQLDRVYEVWHFSQQSSELFSRYIDTFLKIKQEASGFPPECQTEEEKQNYIQEIFRREKILLDSSSIEKNPVRRTIAKLFLNCLWGKFAQRLQLPKTQYLTSQDELNKMLEDSTIALKGMELLTNPNQPESDMILVNYEDRHEFIEECPFGNVVLAAFTTAHARLHLYETLHPLDTRVLYFDTDSIIYQHEEGQFNPTIVNSLGGWTDELDGDRIVKFMSGGPKNYAFETEKGQSVQKVKGITLNYRASQVVTLEALEKMIHQEIEDLQVRYPHKIFRNSRHELHTRPLAKTYQIVYDKRQVINDYHTLPFGY
ncbi:uncharacterized protein LOC111107766 [Crassostrea virginica]